MFLQTSFQPWRHYRKREVRAFMHRNVCKHIYAVFRHNSGEAAARWVGTSGWQSPWVECVPECRRAAREVLRGDRPMGKLHPPHLITQDLAGQERQKGRKRGEGVGG